MLQPAQGMEGLTRDAFLRKGHLDGVDDNVFDMRTESLCLASA